MSSRTYLFVHGAFHDGGMVIAGAAELAPPGSIASIVFLDAILPENGLALTDYPPPRNTQGKAFSPDQADGLVYPPDPVSYLQVCAEKARARPGWNVRELASGHDAMIEAPEALVQLLLA